MLLALCIAFVYSWVLSLLFLGVVPLIAITTSLAVTTLSRRAKQQKKALEQSGKVYYIYIYISLQSKNILSNIVNYTLLANGDNYNVLIGLMKMSL